VGVDIVEFQDWSRSSDSIPQTTSEVPTKKTTRAHRGAVVSPIAENHKTHGVGCVGLGLRRRTSSWPGLEDIVRPGIEMIFRRAWSLPSPLFFGRHAAHAGGKKKVVINQDAVERGLATADPTLGLVRTPTSRRCDTTGGDPMLDEASRVPGDGYARYNRVFLPTAGFLPLGSGKGSYRGYRGIPLNTARIQISNQNR
jgi:hypothetical protein